ncbi:hypothetical protein F5890DRAFT_1610797 [Lentinula detonsa]|uniref:Uncharacterized protein n=1 Tax=Lentinula detonsa TaxID=2804962 RepID=A0AA38PUB0_9AGAR|nr:hypothetical protein F5890DRAFT_1610797 [Lentinula detonsa]
MSTATEGHRYNLRTRRASDSAVNVGESIIPDSTNTPLARSMSHETPAVSPGRVSPTISGRVSLTISGRVSPTISGRVSVTISGCVSATISGCVSATISGRVSATISGRVSATISGHVSATISGRVSATISGHVSATISGCVSATISGRVLADPQGRASGTTTLPLFSEVVSGRQSSGFAAPQSEGPVSAERSAGTDNGDGVIDCYIHAKLYHAFRFDFRINR